MILMFNWYLKRLASMSVRELPYRLWQLLKWKFEEHLSINGKLPGIQKPSDSKIFEFNITGKQIIPANIDIFGKTLDYSQNEINWHCDIFSGESFPLIYSKKINIRKNPDLSAKNVWEINRLQFLTHISLNYLRTGNTVYLDQFMRIMNSWIESNPYLTGINWYSNIEINIRLINWFFCWEIMDVNRLTTGLNPQFDKFVKEKWIPAIYQHCLYSFNNPSRFSSSNNHLIAEYSGLFIASSLWKFKKSGRWLKYAQKGLEKEIVKQHSRGINKEEAAEYIQFITDFFILPFVVANQTNNYFSLTYSQTLKLIIGYIFEFIDIKGNYPPYGDGDDGIVVRLNSDPNSNNFISLLTSALIIFKDPRYKQRINSFDLKNELLFGKKGRDIFESFPVNKESRKSAFYKNEGHYIFRDQKNGKEIYLHFNAAPLGYLSIAAHGHADALSIILSINGFPVIVDPGTYCYHVSKKWRDYFVSTMAHSTVCINGLNQADHTGDTMWTNHYKCKQLSVRSEGSLESVRAEHNGYKNVKHQREILFNKSEGTFTINDDIRIIDDHNREIILLYHLHPDIKVERVTPNLFSLVHNSGIRVSVSIQDFTSCSIVNGQEEPISGWYSDSFLKKVPTNVLYSERTVNQSFKSVTKIIIHEY